MAWQIIERLVAKRKWLKEKLRSMFNFIRQGQPFRVGPLSVVWSGHLEHLKLLAKSIESSRVLSELEEGRDRSTQANPKSVLFLHHSYYNFYYLAQALRRRGFDAISVSLEGPHSQYAKYYHGEDVNLYDEDPERLARNVQDFFNTVPKRFRMVHFYGRGHMSFSPAFIDYGERYDVIPWEFAHLRRCGVKIGYSICGCNDGISQSSFFGWSGGVCNKCIWKDNPLRCSDLKNLAWGHKVQSFCDLIATEGDPALDYQSGPKCYREPLTMVLDSQVWRPDLEIPSKFMINREPEEIIVFHSVGNYTSRTRNGKNIKGTQAVLDAVERLREEGLKIRVEFVTDMPNIELRFIQAQADIVVDQLNYGRYGATAREGMMLGKPTVCYLNPSEHDPKDELKFLKECPVVSANEITIYEVLKDLARNPGKRTEIGLASRAFAVKWHSADAGAARFERVYHRLMADLPPAD